MSTLTRRLARIVALPGCLLASLIACEAVPMEDDAVEKELVAKVSVGIRPIESQLLAKESMQVLFYLSNGTDASIEVLPWSTPLEKTMTADRFIVRIGGEVIPYSGPVVKRPAPGPADFLNLFAGDKKETVVTLSDGYDVSASGEYEIVLREFAFQSPGSDSLTPVVVENTVVVTRQ